MAGFARGGSNRDVQSSRNGDLEEISSSQPAGATDAMLDLQSMVGNKAVAALASLVAKSTPARPTTNVQRTLQIGGNAVSEATITGHSEEIKARAGKALSDQGNTIAEAEWPTIIAELVAIARSPVAVGYPMMSEAIKALRAAGSADALIAQHQPGPAAATRDHELSGEETEADTEEAVDSEPWKKYSKGTDNAAGEAAAPAAPTFTYTHDPHGANKHFTGVLRQGAQWGMTFAAADALMRADVVANLAVLLANSPSGQVTTFYISKDHGSDVGAVDNPKNTTSYYTMQVDVDRKKNDITYHGYPDSNPTLGIGRTAKARPWPAS